MKLLKLTGYLLLLIIISSGSGCDEETRYGPRADIYNLSLSFLDTSGNDLVKGLEYGWRGLSDGTEQSDWYWWPADTTIAVNGGIVSPKLYTLRIKTSTVSVKFLHPLPTSLGGTPKMNLLTDIATQGYYWLNFGAYSEMKHGFPDSIVFALACPYVFGDDKVHEIATWWRRGPCGYNRDAICYRIEVDGKEFPVEKLDTGSNPLTVTNFATIILDR